MALEIWHKRQGGAGMRASARMVLLLALVLTSSVAIAADALTHKQIRQIIIQVLTTPTVPESIVADDRPTAGRAAIRQSALNPIFRMSK
jgi:hypothetical protein